MSKGGKITYNHVQLRKHEQSTVQFLAHCGHNIELIPKIDIEGVHTPDFWMDGETWEMKSPCRKGSSVIKNNLQTAARQSVNVIIDLRRIKRDETKSLREIEREFAHSKRLSKIMVITKSRKIIDFYRHS